MEVAEEGGRDSGVKRLLPVMCLSGWVRGLRLVAFLTGERSAGGGVEAVTAVGAVAAGDVIVGVLGRREGRAVVHLFISSFEAEGRTCLHGNSVSAGTERHTSGAALHGSGGTA